MLGKLQAIMMHFLPTRFHCFANKLNLACDEGISKGSNEPLQTRLPHCESNNNIIVYLM